MNYAAWSDGSYKAVGPYLDEVSDRSLRHFAGSIDANWLTWDTQSDNGDYTLFEGDVSKWFNCPDDLLLTGFYKSGTAYADHCQATWCLEKMKCVSPDSSLSFTFNDVNNCYEHEITLSFDGAADVQCNDG